MKNLLGWINKKFRIADDYLHTYGLEYFAVDHCSLKCYGCSQCSPYLNEHFSDYKVFERSLKILKKHLRPRKLTILGGEPLLHPDIDSIIKITKTSGMFEEIHITTNGTNIGKMSCDFWRNIDVLAISKYPSNSDNIDRMISEVRKKCELYNVKLEIRDMKIFKHIVLSEENADKNIIKEVFNKCIYKFYCHTLSDDKIFRCSPVVNFNKHKNKNNFAPYNNNDYLKIEDSDCFRIALFNYLNSTKPLDGCRFCLGTSGKEFSHRQMTKDELENPDKIKVTVEMGYNSD